MAIIAVIDDEESAPGQVDGKIFNRNKKLSDEKTWSGKSHPEKNSASCKRVYVGLPALDLTNGNYVCFRDLNDEPM